MTFLHSGLHSPTNVKARVANNGRYLIISWDYQAAANYSTVHVRTYITQPSISVNFTTIIGPTKLPCNGSSCSFCVFNTNYNTSCSTFNPVYKISVGIGLQFDLLISYRAGACSKNDSSSCVNSAWKNLNVPSPGGELRRQCVISSFPVLLRQTTPSILLPKLFDLVEQILHCGQDFSFLRF